MKIKKEDYLFTYDEIQYLYDINVKQEEAEENGEIIVLEKDDCDVATLMDLVVDHDYLDIDIKPETLAVVRFADDDENKFHIYRCKKNSSQKIVFKGVNRKYYEM